MRENNFDLLRFFAAIQVLIGHMIHHLKVDEGFIVSFYDIIKFVPGVPVFFLISGFLIALSYDKNSNLKHYTKNRILRIYPALYVNIFIGLAILYYFGFIEFNINFFKWLLAQMSIVQFYNSEMFRGFGVGVINGSLWTISVELTFYLILPILFWIYKANRWILLFLFIISLLLWFYDETNSTETFIDKLLHVSILPYLFIFIIGMLFYIYYEHLKRYIENKFLYWLIGFTILQLVSSHYNMELNIFVTIVKWIFFSFLVFSFAFSFKGVSNRILHGNDYTYGVYIYHMIIINVFVHLNLYGETRYMVYVGILSLLSGILSWHIIEKPFLRLKKNSVFNETNKND